MTSKKVLQAEICKLNEEIVQLHRDQAYLLKITNEQNEELVRWRKENIKLTSERAGLLDVLEAKQIQLDQEIVSRVNAWENYWVSREETESAKRENESIKVELCNALQRRQNQLDHEIAIRMESDRCRMESDEMFESLKRANSSQSKKIVALFNAFESAKVKLCNARVVLASIQSSLGMAARTTV